MNYLEEGTYKIIERPLWWQKRGLQYTASGYGKKIPTDKIAQIGNKLYRIYCCIYSNSGTCYITMRNKTYIIPEF